MSVKELKEKGNAAFKMKKYEEAEGLYREALAVSSSSPSAEEGDEASDGHILFSNLAAVYFEMGKMDQCVEAAEHSIALDPTWLKAYYRKALALDSMVTANPRAILDVWDEAAQHCTMTPLLRQQHTAAKARWNRECKNVEVSSSEDLLERYSLLTNSREKLSTMAHFWNASTKAERLKLFNYFLQMIAGAGGVTEVEVAVEMMIEMPMHNYHDLPRAFVEPWCSYFESCSSDEKTHIFKEIWAKLTSGEQTAVVADLRLFMNMQIQSHHNETSDDDASSEKIEQQGNLST